MRNEKINKIKLPIDTNDGVANILLEMIYKINMLIEGHNENLVDVPIIGTIEGGKVKYD